MSRRGNRRGHSKQTACSDPAQKHYYQPLWTLVSAGVAKLENTVKDMDRFVPKGFIGIAGQSPMSIRIERRLFRKAGNAYPMIISLSPSVLEGIAPGNRLSHKESAIPSRQPS